MSSKLHHITINAIRAVLLLLCFAVFVPCQGKNNGEFVLVIDPGHGGKDYGAIGKITNEKTINLAVAKLLGKMIEDEYDDVKVIFTRKTDTFISLKERADIANKAGGHLFISIHVNSVDKKSKNRTSVQGASVYTLGLHRSASNLEVAKRENSVITLESDYTTAYQGFDPNSTESYIVFEMSQNKHMEQSVAFAQEIENELVENAGRIDKGVRQAGFWVLWATGMPSVLVELDFICNPTQEKFMASENGRKKMATSIFNAFKRYKTSYDKSIKSPIAEKDISADKQKQEKKGDKPKKKKGKKSAKKETTATNGDSTDGMERQTVAADAADNTDDRQVYKEEAPIASPTPSAKTEQKKAKIYKVQFLMSTKLYEKGDKNFKGLYPVSYYKDGNVWKYTFGEAATWNEAEKILKKIRDKFPDAFIITTRDGKRL